MVFLPLVLELRKRHVKVGLGEVMAVAQALAHDLHDSSLDGFYRVARALLVHSESDLDAFDEAFGVCFRGVSRESVELVVALDEWLRDPWRRGQLTAEERASLEALDTAELRRLFEERLREQTARHDGGNRWIGTGGTSPFGAHGAHPSGVRLGPTGGGRSAMAVADARSYRPYRADVVLDVRQVDVALRKLRMLTRDGSRPELDIDATIAETARNAGELEVVLRPPKKPTARVLLLMDVGGSMDPHAELVSQLFSAARRASNFRELVSLYFHNCVYGRLYRTDGMREVVRVADVFERCTHEWKLVVVGDAAMHPGELLGSEWQLGATEPATTGLDWLQRIAAHFDRSAWLNPDPPRFWKGGTAEMIADVFPMFPLTLDGLGEAMAHLSRGAGARPDYKRTSM